MISAAGKSKVYVNGSLTNLNILAGIGALLADIHGQHEHQSLLSVDRQLDMLDSFGGLEGTRAEVAGAYGMLMAVRKKLHELEIGERDRAQREDLLRYQKNEIEAAQLREGEDEDLAKEQRVLANAEKLSGLARMADEALYAGEGSVLSGLKRAVTSVREIVGIDGTLAPVLELLESGEPMTSVRLVFILLVVVTVAGSAPAAQTPAVPQAAQAQQAQSGAQSDQQKPPQKPGEPPPEPQKPPTYEETVVVTASRMEQTLINAPVTMSVIDSRLLSTASAQN